MSIVDDINTATNEAIAAAKEQTTWAGTIITVSPLTVQLDGSGVAVDCLAADFVSLVAQRRCVVQKIGAQLVVMATFGGAQLNTLTIAEQIVAGKYVPTVGNAGGDTNLSATATHTYLNIPASVEFVTPPSGRVAIHLAGSIYASNPGTGATCYIAYEIRTGIVLGTGTVAFAASTARAIGVRPGNGATDLNESGRLDLHTLTPDTQYHAQATYYVTGDGAATYQVNGAILTAYPQF